MKDVKEWWSHLSLRDKRIGSAGVLIVAMAFLYFLIWLPLDNKNAELRSQIQHNQQLLVWMKAAKQKIDSLQNNAESTPKTATSLSLLSSLQESVKNNPLKNKVTQLKQSENDSVQLSFQSVNFDELMSWLIQIWQKQGIIVSQFSATPLDTIGNVNAEIHMKR